MMQPPTYHQRFHASLIDWDSEILPFVLEEPTAYCHLELISHLLRNVPPSAPYQQPTVIVLRKALLECELMREKAVAVGQHCIQPLETPTGSFFVRINKMPQRNTPERIEICLMTFAQFFSFMRACDIYSLIPPFLDVMFVIDVVTDLTIASEMCMAKIATLRKADSKRMKVIGVGS